MIGYQELLQIRSQEGGLLRHLSLGIVGNSVDPDNKPSVLQIQSVQDDILRNHTVL